MYKLPTLLNVNAKSGRYSFGLSCADFLHISKASVNKFNLLNINNIPIKLA